MLHAQAAVPAQQHVDGAFEVLLGQGVLGAMCVLLIVALVVVIRSLLLEKDGRRDDRKDMSEAMKEVNDALRDLVIENNKHSSSIVVDFNRSHDAMKNAAYNQEKAFDDLRASVASMQQEQTRLAMLIQNMKR